MGKASVSNITVPLGFAVAPKALAMARWSVVASPFVILPLPPSRFCPLAPYCPISWHLTAKNSSPGWHPTAPLWLAPYCYSPAGTLLLIVVGWHPLCPVAPHAHLPLSLLRFTLRSQSSLRLRFIMVLHCLIGLS